MNRKLQGLLSLYAHENAGSFLGGMLIFGIATGLFSGVLNNYLYEVLSISRLERGIIEFPRELPGLLLILIIALFSRFSELRIMRVAFLISAAGLAGLTLTGGFKLAAVVFITLWSTGEHLMMPIRDSVGMHMAVKGKEGLAIGGVSGLMNLGQVIGSYSVPLLFLAVPLVVPARLLPADSRQTLYGAVFATGAAVLLIALALTSRIHKKKEQLKRRKLYFRKKFSKYYILEVFFSARKQVFLTFAPYVLIVQYGAKTEYVAFLYGIWSLSNIAVAPLVGRLIDRLGYRKVLVADTLILVALCFLYGFSHRLFSLSAAYVVVSVVFVIDAVLFLAGMARSMYVKSIAEDRNEVTATLSTGISINHLVSIVIAVLGGLLWERLGMETLFSIAGVFGIGSFAFALTLPKSGHTAAADPAAVTTHIRRN